MAQGLSEGGMEERPSSSHWIWCIFDPDCTNNAATREAHRRFCENRRLVRANRQQFWAEQGV